MHEPSVQHNVTQGFKTCFPDNTLLAVLEGSTYQFQYPINDTINFYLLTLSVRRLVLGDTSEPVLQTLLNIARTKQVLLKPTEPNEYYYEAWKLATTLRLTTISTICAHKYIETTTHITTTSKTDVTTTRRIELLQYIITIQRETKVTDREILVYLEALATLYITIGEIEKASQYYREIYEVNVRIYGRTAPQTLRSYETLSTTIQKTTKTEEIQEITRKKYDEISRTLDVTDQRRTNLTWSLIEYYEKKNDTYRLEEILVSFWQSLTRLGHTKDTTIQERKIDVALRYVEFLKRQKRTVEAENILRGLWVDLEQQDNDSTAVITRTKTVGDQLQSLGSIDAARSIFARLWTYYAKTGKTDTAEAKSVSTSLTKTTHESTSETTYEVITLREIFETTIIRSTTKTIDTTTVKTAVTLVDSYWQRQEWTEVVKYATFTLQKLWSAFNTDDLNAPLPSTYTTETIELINRLGFAHYKLRQLEPTERIYRRIFFAVKNTPNTPDELLLSSSKTLIDFYETHTMLEKTVIIYRELYTEILKRHGKTNTLTIKTLYTLGDLAIQLNDTKNAEFAYREIHTNLGTEITHRDAIRAALALSTIYEQQRQYQQAQKIYASLWAMFIKHGKDYDLKPEFAEELYQKYVRILKQETKTNYPLVRQLTIDYRKALVRFYGVSHEVTLKATMTLADINEEKEEHREEAIALYEEADQKSRDLPKGQISQPTLTSIVAARKKLPHLYSTSKLSISPRAITLYTEEFQNNHTKHGHAHRDTLIWLSLLIIAHAKQGNQDSTLKANQIVQASIIDILKNEKNTQRLADSGVKTAEIYVKSGLKPDAEKLLVHLRSQAVFGDSDLSKPLGLAPGVKLDARVWVFIIAFQVTLAGRKDIYSSSMADLINEVFMYEAYRRSVSQKAPFLTTLVYGSRILQFTRDIHDDAGTTRVEKEVLEYFSTNLNAPKTTNVSILREFFGVVITEIHTIEPDVSVLKTSLETVGGLVDKSKFQEAYDLAFLIDRFQQFQGGYSNLIKIDLGFKLALILAGRGKPKSPDQKLRSVMLELSSTITKQILKTVRAAQLSVTDIPIILLNEISGLLGEQDNLDDLEVRDQRPTNARSRLTCFQWILTELWQARHAQQSWSSSVVVNIGRRLVETQFAHGHQEIAIHLCEDMCYNLRRVWGALDGTTLEMHNLLSSFYTNAGNYRKALLVHEDVLRDTVSDKGDELPSAEASQIAVQHLELLKRAYQRLGGWDKDQQVYVDLYQQLAHVFGSEENWKNAKTQSVEKWQPKGADQLGVWTRPESFEFDESKGARKHANYLRKSSGIWTVLRHGHSHRLSRAYSTQSINAQ
jgi:tetratricopeptide (TPR) repeat protein